NQTASHGPMKWDIFISHASEDKDTVARPLAEIMRGKGLRVWIDEQELTLGDSLREKIDEGIAQSTRGVVILSPHFLEKRWPRAELDALVGREMDGQRVILPVWHQISAKDLLDKSPILASRLAIDTEKGLEAVGSAILRALHRDDSKSKSNREKTS